MGMVCFGFADFVSGIKMVRSGIEIGKGVNGELCTGYRGEE